MMISPAEAIAGSSDIFLAIVTDRAGPFPVAVDKNSYRDGDVTVHFNVLASWKGASSDTLSLTTGAGGGDCGYEFVTGGVYLVYGHRDSRGGLHTSICSRTRLASQAHEDSIALGPPKNDRLAGRSWTSYGPPITCPVHLGVPIGISHEWPAAGLAPDARREYPAWAERACPYAGMPLAPEDWRGGSLSNVYVCAMCRELALAWIESSQDRSSGPDNFGDLPIVQGMAKERSESEYRAAYPRGNFAVQYGDGRYNYDSIESRFQRGYGSVHDTTMKFDLTEAELDRIYETTVKARLLDLDVPHPPYPDASRGAVVRVDRASVLYVRCGIVVRQFTWYPDRAPKSPTAESSWGRLMAAFREVQRVIANRTEVLALTPLPSQLDDPLRAVRTP